MSTAPPKRPFVVVALDAADGRDFVIELAGSVAASGAPQLLGLFVENAHLLEHSRSRLAREIMLSGVERELDRTALERQLRAQAARVRASFEAASSRLGLHHIFEVARGDILAETIKRAADADAIVLNLGRAEGDTRIPPDRIVRQVAEAELPLVLLARQGWLSGRCIAVIVDDVRAADAMLDAAARLARLSNSPITAILVTSTPEGANLAERVTETLRLRGSENSDVLVFNKRDIPGIVVAATACRARLVVASSPSEPGDYQIIEELWRRLPGALMLVRP